MAGITSEAAKSAQRRMASISGHLQPESNQTHGVGMSACTSGFDDTYHRVHGAVPTHIPPWKAAIDDSGKEFADIIYEKAVGEGIAKVTSFLHRKLHFLFNFLLRLFSCMIFGEQITINRPERRNAFRPQTVKELMRAFNDVRDDDTIGVVILTGKVLLKNSNSLKQ